VIVVLSKNVYKHRKQFNNKKSDYITLMQFFFIFIMYDLRTLQLLHF